MSRHGTTARPCWGALAAALALGASPAAQASAQVAMDMGCYNCHGTPPRKSAPTFAELARRYGAYRNDAVKQQQLAHQLREGSIFSHIDAHERLSLETATALVRWLCDGAA